MRRVKVLFDGASAQVGVVRLSSCRGTVLNERRRFEQYIYPDFTNGVVAKANAPIYGAANKVLGQFLPACAVLTGLRSFQRLTGVCWMSKTSVGQILVFIQKQTLGNDECIVFDTPTHHSLW